MAANKASAKVDQLSANNLILVMSLISLLVIGVTVLIGKTLVKDIVRDTKVVNAKQKANSQLTTDLSAAPSLVSNFQGLGTESTILSDALPTTSDLPSLISTLESMAGTSGLKLKSVDPSLTGAATAVAGAAPAATPAATSTVPTPQPYDFTVGFEGSFDAIQKFMNSVELSARPMRGLSMHLSGTSGSDLTGTMDMETYFQAKAVLPISQETIK